MLRVLLIISSLLVGKGIMADLIDFTHNIDAFSGHFLKESLSQKQDSNIISSPLSADIAMAMVGLGSSGETKKEIEHSLLVDNLERGLPSTKMFMEKANNVENIQLRLANKIYVNPSSRGNLDSVQPKYRSLVQDTFKSDIQQVDFSKSRESADDINAWVESQTNHKIKHLIDYNSLNAFTKAVIVNAIYFKGTWDKKFTKELTQKANFTLFNGNLRLVEMMNQRGEYYYQESEELDAKVIRLPFVNKAVSMMVFLPNKYNGIDELVNKLANGIISHTRNMYKADVILKFPKFKIETTLNLKDIFEKLGAKRIFTPAAELGSILEEDSGLYVSDGIQKAFIEVNEEGSEAAAASAFTVQTLSLNLSRPPVKHFNADHPFYFAIQYEGTTMFNGVFKTGQSEG